MAKVRGSYLVSWAERLNCSEILFVLLVSHLCPEPVLPKRGLLHGFSLSSFLSVLLRFPRQVHGNCSFLGDSIRRCDKIDRPFPYVRDFYRRKD
jgi:hypothetical protein